jgi:predicted XRE-type DNA-binding protein
MRKSGSTNEPSHTTTGNVLEYLGFSAREIREMEIQYALWAPIRAEIEPRKLTQAALAKELAIGRLRARSLLQGHITRFGIFRLMQFADHLKLAVTAAGSPKTEL